MGIWGNIFPGRISFYPLGKIRNNINIFFIPQSCKRCSGNCKDEKKECVGWAKKGYCKSGKFVDYMKLRCKYSCQRC